MNDSYHTIAARKQTEIKIERSRFIGTAIPASSKSVAEEEYQKLRGLFHDATHNCFAYLVGRESNQSFRYSDDGEPSGTAGKQIYETILTRELVDVLVVVTRYYGGVKLGTGGLSRAYREAASLVLDQAAIVERFQMQPFRLRFSHEQVSIIMKVLSEFDLKPIDTQYGEQVEVSAAIRTGSYERLCRAIIDRTHGRTVIEPMESTK